ncbi:TolC family protein [Fibrella aquatica]|uniref:TolC family protein n=1 Tax=Fibrella aquatica TaxID=3242487 RepID=UPI0035200D68
MRHLLPSLLLVLLALNGMAQPHLDAYVQLAFTSNESIRQQQVLLQRNLAALDEAKRLYRPTMNLTGTYTLAGGGRTIDFPLGDLLNPAYSTLNRLTGSEAFPQLQNRRILLNPNNFYDIHTRTTYPLVNAEIRYNEQIKRQQVDLQRIDINLFKRELAKEVKVAYYRYLQATEAIRIYENALTLVQENQRVNTALFNNQKVNRTSVVRSNNEVTRIGAQVAVARQTQHSAQAFLNFLLNRPAYTAIESDAITNVPTPPTSADTTLSGREELAKLRQARAINTSLVGLAATYRKPKVNLFVDLGAQAFDFRVNRQSAYYLAGLSFDLSLFSAGRNALKVTQANLDGEALDANTRYVTGQLRLQITTATNALFSALTQHEAAQSQVGASQRNYRDLQLLYREGQLLYIELLDAQNQLIADQLQVNISRFDAWTKHAELERATAAINLN